MQTEGPNSIRRSVVTASSVEIPVQYRRPSTLLNVFETDVRRIVKPGTAISAEDARGTLRVTGTPQDVAQVRKLVELMDLPRQRAEIAIDIQAPVDKMHYSYDVQLYGGQAWKTEDSELGLKIAVLPGVQLGKTVTLTVITEFKNRQSQSVFRLAPGQKAFQTFGSITLTDPKAGSAHIESSPTVTFRFLGLHGE